MTHPEDEQERDPQAPPEDSGSGQHDEKDDERHDQKDDEQDDLSPEAREIEEDPSLNPDNEILRDIRGG